MKRRLLAILAAAVLTFTLATPADASTRFLLYFHNGTSTKFQCTRFQVRPEVWHWNVKWRPAHNGGRMTVRVSVAGTAIPFTRIMTARRWPPGQALFDLPIVANLPSRICWNPLGTRAQAAGFWRVEAYARI
jgi:hypothetical protein